MPEPVTESTPLLWSEVEHPTNRSDSHQQLRDDGSFAINQNLAESSTHLPHDPNHEAVYNRFTSREKHIIVALVAWGGLLPFFVSGTFVPSIPQIALDMQTTGEVVSLAVSLSIFAIGVGSLFWATHSGYYGRRPIYLVGLPLLAASSVGVGRARDVPSLMIWRFVQAFSCSGGISVGAAVIGDIYAVEQRGGAMGVLFAAMLLGPALAPLAGGLAAHYASWRVMQYSLSVSAMLVFFFMLALLPETSHPGMRGIDRWARLATFERRRRNENGRERLKCSIPSCTSKVIPIATETGSFRRSGLKYKVLNPFTSLWLLRSPNLLAITISGFCVLLPEYVLLTPLAYTIGARYGITNEAIIGLCFVPCGVGNCIGAPLGGRMSDAFVVRWRARRKGKWVPEDRLRITLVAAAFLVPASVVVSGLLTTYVGGTLGLAGNLVCLFINGLGVDMVLSPSAAYIVDIMHNKSAQSMAVNNGFRSLIMAAAIAGIFPSINIIGVAWTNAATAVIAWVGFLLLWLTIRYGESMRAWVDVGYSTPENN